MIVIRTESGEHSGRSLQAIVRRVYGDRAVAVRSTNPLSPYIGTIVRRNQYLRDPIPLDDIVSVEIDGTEIDRETLAQISWHVRPR